MLLFCSWLMCLNLWLAWVCARFKFDLISFLALEDDLTFDPLLFADTSHEGPELMVAQYLTAFLILTSIEKKHSRHASGLQTVKDGR